jgi:hypothetical protein
VAGLPGSVRQSPHSPLPAEAHARSAAACRCSYARLHLPPRGEEGFREVQPYRLAVGCRKAIPHSVVFEDACFRHLIEELGFEVADERADLTELVPEGREGNKAAQLDQRRRQPRESGPVDLGEHLLPALVGGHQVQGDVEVGCMAMRSDMRSSPE